MKKVKNEIKRAFRLPGNAAVMTMMAVILVCAAPALVSIIDDSYSQNYDVDYVLNDDVSLFVAFKEITNEASDDFSHVFSDNELMVSFVDPNVVDFINYIQIRDIDPDIIQNVGKVVIITDVKLHTNNSSTWAMVGSEKFKTFSGLTPILDDEGVRIGYEREFSSYEKVLIADEDITSFRIALTLAPDADPTVLKEFNLQFTGNKTIPYGEIIIGATGALLLVCAILATPWVSTSGLTVKRRR